MLSQQNKKTVIEFDGSQIALPDKDYVSEGLVRVMPDDAFPNMTLGNVDDCTWDYLRKEIPHNWYVDKRYPVVGFLSRDEASILHNLALPFADKNALEIGVWRGWSAAHLALAGVQLDLIDPMLVMDEHRQDVAGVFEKLGVAENVTLYDGYSPDRIHTVAAERGQPWDFVFIDGDHEGDAPMLDAAHAVRYAAENAIFVFHDLVAPAVAAGLDYMRSLGWNTRVFQTMQIMGVAWRGNVEIPHHVPDPNVAWTLPDHLQSYDISGETKDEKLKRLESFSAQPTGQTDYRREYHVAVDHIRDLYRRLSVVEKGRE